MKRDSGGVFVIRIHHNMAYAISSQNVNIMAYNFDSDPVVLTPENIQAGLKSLPKLFRNRTLLDGVRDTYKLFNAIDRAKPEIVHVNALQDLLPAFIAVQFCAIKGHRPTIIAMSRNSLTWGSARRAQLYANLIKFFSDGFVALAVSHKDELLRLGVPADKVAVIPNPYDPACLRVGALSEHGAPKKIRKFIYVAHICENKAQDTLIAAASSVMKKYPDVQFELVGKVLAGAEQYAEKLHAMIKEYGIAQAIHFTGEMPYEDVLTSVQKSDAFVFPTLAEMMPRSVIEAMTMGKPVIASAVDGVLDLIQNRKTGLLVQPGSSTELAGAICEFIEHPDLANALGLDGQKYVLEFCSPERVGKQLCDFYEYRRSKKLARMTSFTSPRLIK